MNRVIPRWDARYDRGSAFRVKWFLNDAAPLTQNGRKKSAIFFFRVILSFLLPRAHGILHPIRINSSFVRSTDSTIAIAPPPPKKQRFSLTEVFVGARHEGGCHEKNILLRFLDRKGLQHRTMASGWQGSPYSGRYGRELVSKPAISPEKV